MPALWQYTLYLADFEEATGWQENVVVQSDSANVLDPPGGPLLWASKRAACLSEDSGIIAYARRRIDGVRQSFVKEFDTPYMGTALNGENAVAALSIDYKFTAGTSRRNYWFRSIPKLWVNSGRLTVQGEAALPTLDYYCSWLVNTVGISIRVPLATNVWKDIDSIGPSNPLAPGSNLNITTTWGMPAPVLGGILYMKGLRGFPYLNGRWRIAAVNGNVVTLRGSSRYYIAATGLGQVRLFSPSAVAVASYGYAGVGRHETGAIFTARRGRSSAKVLHSR